MARPFLTERNKKDLSLRLADRLHGDNGAIELVLKAAVELKILRPNHLSGKERKMIMDTIHDMRGPVDNHTDNCDDIMQELVSKLGM